MANKVKIQTYLSDESHKRVAKCKAYFERLGVQMSDSEAVNQLIEKLIADEFEALCEEGFKADNDRQENAEGDL